MMKTCVAVLVVLVVVLVEGGQAARCKLDVLDRLLELWQEKGIPVNLTTKSIELSPDYEVAATDNYFADQARISCVVTSWTEDATFSSTFIYTDNTNKTTAGSTVTDLPGQTYQSDKQIRRYHVPAGNLVNAFYKCDENGQEGPAEGLVKVWPGFEQDALEAAIVDLEYVLGRKLSSQRLCQTLTN